MCAKLALFSHIHNCRQNASTQKQAASTALYPNPCLHNPLIYRTFAARFPPGRLMQEWWNGRHEGLKILWPEKAVWVRVPLPVRNKLQEAEFRLLLFLQALIFHCLKPAVSSHTFADGFTNRIQARQ